MQQMIGRRLREARIARGLSQKQAAERAQLSEDTIARWEKDRVVPQLAPLNDLLRVLEISQVERLDLLGALDRKRAAAEVRSSVWTPFLGDLVRAMRERRGLSLDEAARKFGVNASTVSRWERGSLPDKDRGAVFDIYQPRPEEREVLNSGSLHLNTRPAEDWDASACGSQLESLTQAMANAESGPNELAFLVLERQIARLFARHDQVFTLLVRAWVHHAEFLMWRNQILGAYRYLDRALDGIARLDRLEPFCFIAFGMEAKRRKDARGGNNFLAEAEWLNSYLESARRLNCDLCSLRGIADDLYRAGYHDEAMKYFDWSRRASDRVGADWGRPLADLVQARALLDSGRAEEATSFLATQSALNPNFRLSELMLILRAHIVLGGANVASQCVAEGEQLLAQFDLDYRRNEWQAWVSQLQSI